MSPAREAGLVCHVHEFLQFRDHVYVAGWAYHPVSAVRSIEYQLPETDPVIVPDWRRPSPDVQELHGPLAEACRFDFHFDTSGSALVRELRLLFTLENGQYLEFSNLSHEALSHDPYHQLLGRFFEDLSQSNGASVLEIGSRNRSGNIRRGNVHATSRYVGFDLLPGENVDVVGDAHEISALLQHDQFDRVFSISTFEHLAMPWKAAIEINRVMKVGGLLLVATHQTWPLHEEPWDFWRFSAYSWNAIFNSSTGFEVVETAMGEPGSIVAHILHAPVDGIQGEKARLASAVICRKIKEPTVNWNVKLESLLDGIYPL